MNYLIIILIILFWLDYRSFKKNSIRILEDLENRIKQIEFPKDWREMRKLWGAGDETIDKEIKEMSEKMK